MSQYAWKTREYEFLTGWDRPLKYFFLVVDFLDEGKREDDPVFSNLALPTGPAMSIPEIKETCVRYGSALPLEIESKLLGDLSNENPGIKKPKVDPGLN